MSQEPVGEVVLRTRSGESALALVHENLYVRGVRAFHAAVRGKGEPTATGEDGVRSLAVALTALRSVASGRAEVID
jgi:1,5-anhydro-D-fructose reductase (1,5-anhydro-D-mannitol-forming)